MIVRIIVAFWLLLFLGLAEQGHAAISDSKLDAMATFVAKRPVDAQCVRSSSTWTGVLASIEAPATVMSFYNADQPGVIHLGPRVCKWLDSGPYFPLFGGGLNVLAHEASHARGVSDEAAAACLGKRWADDLAVRFFSVKRGTKAMKRVLSGAQYVHNLLAPQYRERCG